MIHRLSAALALALLAAETTAVALKDNDMQLAQVADDVDVDIDVDTGNADADVDVDVNGEDADGEDDADNGEDGEEEAAEEPAKRGNNVQVKIDFNLDVKREHHDHSDEDAARDQAIVDALAAAQEALEAAEDGLDAAAAGDADTGAADGGADAGADADADEGTEGTPTHIHIALDDDTEVNGTRWADLKGAVMPDVDGYKATTDYTDLSAEDQAILDALIEAQTALGDDAAVLTSSGTVEVEYTIPPPEPVPEPVTLELTLELSDSNTIAGMAWADWKAMAMLFGFDQTSDYTDASNLDQALFDAHIAAQFAAGNTSDLPPTGEDATQVELTWTEDGSNAATGSTTVQVVLNDLTEVGGTDWADLKADAMSVDYDTSEAYTSLSARDKTIVDALIAQQELEDAFDSDLTESVMDLEIQTS